MSGGTRIAGVDFPVELTRSIVFVASCCDRFWCETGAVIAACLREAFDCLMVMWTGCGKRPEMQLAGGRATPLAPDGWLPGTMVAGPSGSPRSKLPNCVSPHEDSGGTGNRSIMTTFADARVSAVK